jgi:asparagine synthase (glutamine-hydrolysing)
MSFIFGVIDFGKKPVKPEEIRALAHAVKWEGFNEQIEVEESFAIGYCGHPKRKPKTGIFKTEELIVLADIRIYNAGELKKSVDFASPAEAFARAYLRWGIHCANRINGDFTVVVIDRAKNAVHLFRDHIGARPLTYWFHENRLIFASHEFGIVKSGLVSPALSEEKMLRRFFDFKEEYSQTAFNDVFKVVPGHCVSFLPDRKQITKYWRPEEIKQNRTLSFEDAVTRLRQLILAATQNRMEPGKTGAHVSGGIDSTGIASIVADHIGDKTQLLGYSWSPEEFKGEVEGVNEKEFIEAFSVEKEVPVKYLRLEEKESVRNSLLPEFEQMHIEHPTMQMAGKDGVQILFSGWGGDEFVSLSTRGTFNHLFFKFKWFTLLIFIRKVGIRSSISRFRTDILPLLVPFGLLKTYQSQYTDWSKLRFLKALFILKHWKLLLFHERKNIFGYGNRTRFMLNLLENYHIPERMDNWGMHAERYGFEYKYPLLDKDVLEFWFGIPIEYTYRDMQSRLLFREAMKGILTEKIRVRKDKGEGLRIAYSRQNMRNGKSCLAQLFFAIPEQEHLSFFRPKAFENLINQPPERHKIKEISDHRKLTFYLRYVGLIKKYNMKQSTTLRESKE